MGHRHLRDHRLRHAEGLQGVLDRVPERAFSGLSDHDEIAIGTKHRHHPDQARLARHDERPGARLEPMLILDRGLVRLLPSEGHVRPR